MHRSVFLKTLSCHVRPPGRSGRPRAPAALDCLGALPVLAQSPAEAPGPCAAPLPPPAPAALYPYSPVNATRGQYGWRLIQGFKSMDLWRTCPQNTFRTKSSRSMMHASLLTYATHRVAATLQLPHRQGHYILHGIPRESQSCCITWKSTGSSAMMLSQPCMISSSFATATNYGNHAHVSP